MAKWEPPNIRFTRFCILMPDGCVLWRGGRNNHGYGTFGLDGKTVLAHIYAWERKHGPVPVGLELDHKCRVRRCVNDEHLEPVTHLENVRRGEKASRTQCPKGHVYDEQNTYFNVTKKRTSRQCKKCRADGERNRRAKNSK